MLAIQRIKSIADRSWFQALAAGLLVFALLAFFLVKDHYSLFGRVRSDNLFVHLSWSFLNGKLDLDYVANVRDISIFHDKLYAYWPPLCAFLLMPLVKMHGPYVGDKWLDVLLVAVSAAAGWLLMDFIAVRAKWRLSLAYKIFLTLFLALGTSNLVLTIMGYHYYMAQVAAAAMMMMSLLCLFRLNRKPWHFLLSGTFWGLAILSRMHLILSGPLFLYVAFFGTRAQPEPPRGSGWRSKLLNVLCLAAPIVLVLLFFAWYNWARFGSVFDNGVSHHLMAPRFEPEYKVYGYIHPHYFWYNAYYTLIRVPWLEHQSWWHEPNPGADWTEGYSLFFQSPPLLYALASLRALKKDRLVSALWLSTVLVSVPILCLMGSGWVQFGARYLFDLFPLLFPLTVIGTKGRLTPVLALLVLASLAINFWGLHIFGAV